MQSLLHFLDGLGNFALFLLVMGFIVFVHELGHFLTAKWAGVRVTQFALGFGKAACSWRKGMGFHRGSTEPELEKRIRKHLADRGESHDGELTNEQICQAADQLGVSETEYRLNWLPLGGYVKMLGQEDMDPAKVSQDKRSFNKAPVWKRIIIVSAGVTMNMIFAVVFFIAAFMWGIKYPPAEIGMVMPDRPAATATAVNDDKIVGLQPGDRLIAINGEKPSDFNSLRVASALTRTGQTLTLTVERPAFGDQKAQTLEFQITPKFDPDNKMLQIGVSPPDTLQLTKADGELGIDQQTVDKIYSSINLPLKPGWTLAAVNGQPVTASWQYLRMVADSKGQPMQLTFRDEHDATHEVTAQPESQMQYATLPQTKEKIPNLLGLVPAVSVADVTDKGAAHGVLQKDDVIARIGQTDWPTPTQIVQAVSNANPAVTLEVIRDGRRETFSITPRSTRILFGRKLIGIAPTYDTDHVRIARVLDDSPFAKSDITPGTIIASVNDTPVRTWNDLRKALENAGENITLHLVRPVLGGMDQQVAVTIPAKSHDQLAALAWFDPVQIFIPANELQKADAPMQALSMGFDKTWLFLKQTYVTFLRLADRSLSPTQLSGPVGIATIGTTMAHRGLAYLMYFAGLISVNLAVVNFLPLPIVDGGLFVMLLLEKARGRPLPISVQTAITYAGLVLLGVVFLFVTFNDIVRMVHG